MFYLNTWIILFIIFSFSFIVYLLLRHCNFYVNYFGFVLTSIFGFCLVIILSVQIIIGFSLTFYYVCYLFITFDVINFICIEVYWGFLICIFHNIFASLFISFIYMHFVSGVFISFVVNNLLFVNWLLGNILFLLSIIVGVLGYILPFGNLGYWAFCAINNLIVFICFVLVLVLIYLLFSWFFIYDSSLLIIHFNFAFWLAILVIFHIVFLHNFCSINNVSYCIDFIYGFLLTLINDLLFINLLLILFLLLIYFNPILLGDNSNIIFVNFLFSPFNINPEWYFCSIYAILRLFFLNLVGILMVIFYFVYLLV